MHAWSMGHAGGLQAEDEGVTSGFSPRALSLPHSQGAWPPDQLPSTPHKRIGQGQGSLAGSGAGLGDICLAIPPVLGAADYAGTTHRRGGTGMGPTNPSPLGMGLGQSLEQPPMPLNRVSPPEGILAYEKTVSPRMSMAHKLQRSPSIPRSPTITKEINSLSDLADLSENSPSKGQGGGFRERQLDLQPLMPALLVTAALLLWCLRGVPEMSFSGWVFPEDLALRGCLEFLALVLLLSLGAVLARRAYPSLVLNLRVPDSWHLNLYLNLNLRGLGPALRRGVRYLHLAPSGNGRFAGPAAFYSGEKSSSAHGSGWEGLERGPSLLPGPPLPKASGRGVHVYSNGDRFEGEFYQGKCAGSGVYYFAMSGRYEGDWVDGKYDGYGVETWSRGSRYRGQYRQGLREGYGVYRFYTGDVYSGLWHRGQSHGCGIQTCADGSKFIGEFAWGAKHGYGKYIFRNGDVYAGEYFADKMHGYGVYSFANLHKYEGAWHEGRKQGLGLYSFRNGEARAGGWHRGALATRSTHCASASAAPSAVSHTRVLHAVQEARRAARKAESVMLVEDRVAKAVAGANRSAVAARVAAVKATQAGSSRKLAEL